MSMELDPLFTHNVTDEERLRHFLDRLEEQLQWVSTIHAQLLFTQYEQRERPHGLEEVEAVQAGLLSNSDYQATVARFVGQIQEPLLARRAHAWNQTFRGARVSARADIRRLVGEIADHLVRHRFAVQGEELGLSQVRHILRTEPNRERRHAAWLAFAPLSSALQGRTRELFNLRNDAARTEGYETYAHMQLDAQGMALGEVKAILTDLSEASDPIYRRILHEAAERCGLDSIVPWDVRYLLEGQGGADGDRFPRAAILPRLSDWAAVQGVSLEQLGISMHFLEIPYNGLCMTITPRDIRILGNPTDGLSGHKTSFHELGHALHAAHSDPGSYILRREPSIFNEGMAELLGYTVLDPEWLAHVGLGPEEAREALSAGMGPWLSYLRTRSAHALFEYEAYANPGADLDAVCGATEARLLGCTYDATPRWAGEPNAWYSRYPVYWQNYVLADLVASQINHDLKRRFGGLWRRPDALAFVREQYWAPGAAVDWQEKLRLGTGQGLAIDALVADLTG